MNGQAGARQRVASVLSAAGGPRVLAVAGRHERLTVLNYHRIAEPPDAGFPFLPGIVSTSPAGFALQMEWARRNFSVVGLDDLLAWLRDGWHLPARPLLVTFDDGYLDNYLHAAPVLRRLGLPAVMFLIAGSIGRDETPWWDDLARHVRHTAADQVSLPLLGETDLSGRTARAAALDALLDRLKRVPDGERRDALPVIRRALGAPTVAEPEGPLFMTWDHARELVAAGIDCQPHTMTHPILTRIDPDGLREELAESARVVCAETGREASAFAYPNGTAADFDPAVVRAVADAGYEVAFTMEHGPTTIERVRECPLTIPRVALVQGDTFELFKLKASGLLPAVDRFRRRGARRIAIADPEPVAVSPALVSSGGEP